MANKRARFDGKFKPELIQWLREESIRTNRSMNNIAETALLEKSGIQAVKPIDVPPNNGIVTR